jgi:hypothetical protein
MCRDENGIRSKNMAKQVQPTSPPATAENINDAVQAAVKQALAVHQARSDFITKNMMDLPQLYRDQMPATADLGELAAKEQELRADARGAFSKMAQSAKDKGHLPSYAYSPEAIAASIAADGQAADPAKMSYAELAAARLAGMEVGPAGGTGGAVDTSNMSAFQMMKAIEAKRLDAAAARTDAVELTRALTSEISDPMSDWSKMNAQELIALGLNNGKLPGGSGVS